MSPLVSFSCLMVLAKPSRMKINNSGKSVHPYLVPDVGQTSPSFFPFSKILIVEWLHIFLYYVALRSFYTQFFKIFIMKGCCILLDVYSASIHISIWFLSCMY